MTILQGSAVWRGANGWRGLTSWNRIPAVRESFATSQSSQHLWTLGAVPMRFLHSSKWPSGGLKVNDIVELRVVKVEKVGSCSRATYVKSLQEGVIKSIVRREHSLFPYKFL